MDLPFSAYSSPLPYVQNTCTVKLTNDSLTKQSTAMETQPNAPAETRKDVYGIINSKIIEQLDKGTVPWQKPWKNGGVPQNLITKKQYHGINLLLLSMVGFEHNLFISFNQLQTIGGKVRRGEKGHMVVYWNVVRKEDTEPRDENAEEKKKVVLRYYYVFNISQCENIPERLLPVSRTAEEIPTCESIVSSMPQCPAIKHKEQRAYYNPTDDFVNMPKKRSFDSDESYYSTLFHELVHSTGHENRLNRKTLTQMSEFGSEAYSIEELIAEMGTCYLQSFAGITSEFQHSAAYLQGWLGKLKNDKYFIFQAASAAQKAVDYILNIQDTAEETSEQE